MIVAILLSGGTGTHMGVSTPKQYLPLAGKPLAQHSFEILAQCPLLSEIIIVCEKKYRSLFRKGKFADPGHRRQDSLYNACAHLEENTEMIVIHDAARPLLAEEDLEKVIYGGLEHGAAALAHPIRATIKKADENHHVLETPQRHSLYEVQTPQVLKKEILFKGFEKTIQEDITVPDDVSLAELIGYPVKLIMGNPENIKINTPEDLTFAENICRERLPAYQV